MKFEFKTENEYYSKAFLLFLTTLFKLVLIIIFCDIALKLRVISRSYQIEYNCELLYVEKSKSNLKRLSRLVPLKNKQKIWEFCREVVK